MDSLVEEMDQSESEVKAEPNITAENFEVGTVEVNETSEDEIDQTQEDKSPDVDESATGPSGDASTADSTDELLTLDEKIEIAQFVANNPTISPLLVRENFSTKFKKEISVVHLQKIISTGERLYYIQILT